MSLLLHALWLTPRAHFFSTGPAGTAASAQPSRSIRATLTSSGSISETTTASPRLAVPAQGGAASTLAKKRDFDRNFPSTAAARRDPVAAVRKEIPPSPEAGEISAGDEQLYRLSLARVARRLRLQDADDIPAGRRGRVELSVELGVAGPRVAIFRSSGDEEIDALAMRLIGMAARHAEVPAGMLGRRVALKVPLEFGGD